MKNRKNKIQRYKFKDELPENFISELKLNITPTLNNFAYAELTLFDTFDWGLFNNDLILIKKNGSLYLHNYKNGRSGPQIPWKIKKNPTFTFDLPECKLKNQLAKYLGPRALIPVHILSESMNTFNVLNNDEKTTAHLYIQKIKFNIKSSNKLEILILEPVRGYMDEFVIVENALIKNGFTKIDSSPYIDALNYSGTAPGSYNSKFELKLDPENSSVETLKIILKHLISIVKINEDGIKKDIDIEFLHDFRVAVRKARSAISQIKYVLPKEVTIKLKNDFSKIGKMTNRLRDLDVYMLKQAEYTEMLPDKLQIGMKPIFKKLANERSSEQRKLRTALSGKEYCLCLKDAEECLEKEYPFTDETKNSNVKILPLAKKFIWKKYNKVVSSGKSIDKSTPDTQLHTLRIECKNLRYLLEFFCALFPAEKIDIIISQLKKLQDNLGDLNDLYVQQESLSKILNNYDPKTKNFINVSMSIGGLIAILGNRKYEVRKSFKKKFSEFTRKSNSQLYRSLFAE